MFSDLLEQYWSCYKNLFSSLLSGISCYWIKMFQFICFIVCLVVKKKNKIRSRMFFIWGIIMAQATDILLTFLCMSAVKSRRSLSELLNTKYREEKHLSRTVLGGGECWRQAVCTSLKKRKKKSQTEHSMDEAAVITLLTSLLCRLQCLTSRVDVAATALTSKRDLWVCVDFCLQLWFTCIKSIKAPKGDVINGIFLTSSTLESSKPFFFFFFLDSRHLETHQVPVPLLS